MDELSTREVVEFLRGRLSTQDRVAMRMTAEARDDVSMAAGLRRRVLQYPTKLRCGLFDELLCELDRPLKVR